MDFSTITFIQLRQQIFRQYQLADWQAALTLLEQEGVRFEKPSEAATVVYWRACFLALLYRSNEAMNVLEEGVQQGYWWAAYRLRNDPDLRSLQDNAAYETLIAECERCRQQAQLGIQTSRLVAEPSSETEPPYPLVLALHGHDGNAAETLPHYAPLSRQGWLVAALQSSQLAGMDGYHWTDEERAQSDVQHHLRELSDTHSLDQTRLTMGGFSGGGRTALLLSVTGAIRARQVISVAASLREETLAALDWRAIRTSDPPRFLLIVGEQDQPVWARLRQQAETFGNNGLDVELQIVPDLGHDIPADFASRVISWLI